MTVTTVTTATTATTATDAKLLAPAGRGFVRREAVMGTVVTFDVRTDAPVALIEGAIDVAVDWLHWVDRAFSTYKHSSEVSRFDRGELPVGELSDELRFVLSLCQTFSKKTEGYFDAWAAGGFDPSGVVKGWSIDRASSILARHGLPDHAVDGGGDIRLRGNPGPGPGAHWAVAVRHPLRPGAYCAVLSLPPGEPSHNRDDEGGDGGWAVATSGTYERGAHVIDPFTGSPATALASVTVVGRGRGLTSADAYATAALAMGTHAPGWLAGLSGYDALVVGAGGEGWATPGFSQLTVGSTAGLPPPALPAC